jgi:hypothetical protein
MTALRSKRFLLHVGLPGAAALGFCMAASVGLLLLASPGGGLDATAVSHAADRVVAADEALSHELSSWQGPAIVKVAADPRGLLETLSHGDRLTITTADGRTLVLKLRATSARPAKPANEIMLCHAEATDGKGEVEPICVNLDLVLPQPAVTTQKAL